jgi:ABC-type branched-subunit amino acid transport system substrate-binding protein
MLLLAGLALSACSYLGMDQQPKSVIGANVEIPTTRGKANPTIPPGSTTVALLVPLSGPRADIGQALVRGAQGALYGAGAPGLDQRDTGGTPEGAAEAARAAIAAGAGVILGPLTSAETAAVAPIASAAGIPVLAFTNDAQRSAPGVWTLGIGPAQQIHRLAGALQAQGKAKLAALVPENEIGRAMSAAMVKAAADLGLPEPKIRQYGETGGIKNLNAMVRDLSDYANRRGPLEAQRNAARASGTAEGRKRAAQIARASIPPAPFDALLISETGDGLEMLTSLLAYYDVDRPAVRLLAPAAIAAEASRASHAQGTWYAAPDPAARAAFEQAFSARFGGPPPAIADVAFDAASIARVNMAGATGYSAASLARPEGYMGANGLLVLQPDGHVRRGLAIFEIQRGGPQMVEPAPQTAAAPGA